jgi:transposase
MTRTGGSCGSAGSRRRSFVARQSTGSGLGCIRWVVERTFAWLHHFKRLLVRYDRRAEIHEASLALACCLVCFRRVRKAR